MNPPPTFTAVFFQVVGLANCAFWTTRRALLARRQTRDPRDPADGPDGESTARLRLKELTRMQWIAWTLYAAQGLVLVLSFANRNSVVLGYLWLGTAATAVTLPWVLFNMIRPRPS